MDKAELENGFGDFEHLAASYPPSGQNSRSVGTIGLSAGQMPKIADESGFPDQGENPVIPFA
jgi:hypothetical protein